MMLLLLAPAGCSVTAQRVVVPIDSAAAKLDLVNLSLALNRIVSQEGLRAQALLESRPLLDAYLADAGACGPSQTPEAFPTPQARLAYTLNCRNACLLRSLIELSSPPRVPEMVPTTFERRFAFHIDGAWQTANDLAAMARREAGDDWRVVLALATVTNTGPPMPDRPWLADLLDAQLDRAMHEAVSSPRVVRLDHGEVKQILFWPGLWRLRHTLIADYERRMATTNARMLNVVLSWTDSSFERMTLNSAVGYAEGPMLDDRRIAWTDVNMAER